MTNPSNSNNNNTEELSKKQIVVGLAGASGTIYGIRLLQWLVELEYQVHLLVSPSTWKVMQSELEMPGVSPSTPISEWTGIEPKKCEQLIHNYNIRDIAAPMASGTFRAKGMIIVPCSMKTLAAIAHGYTDNLLTRCADCFLKEKRRLIIVPRETPLSLIHLRNMVTASEAGAHIIPAMPGFYHNPKTIEDLVDFMVMKILESCEIDSNLRKLAWTGPKRASSSKIESKEV